MKLVKRIRIKLYYQLLQILFVQKECDLPSEFNEKINLFIYFDYEREFGNSSAKISNEQISDLLHFLKQNKILKNF